jgi:hypothetical protein
MGGVQEPLFYKALLEGQGSPKFQYSASGTLTTQELRKKYEKNMDIPHCNRLKRKPLVTNAILKKLPPISWRLRTRSWDIHEENIMPERDRARLFFRGALPGARYGQMSAER